jgi:hypothetical protein
MNWERADGVRRVVLIVDYENFRKLAHGRFAPSENAGAVVLEPTELARRVIARRAGMRRAGGPLAPVRVVGISVHRGLPDPEYQDVAHAMARLQHASWVRANPNVTVHERPLAYEAYPNPRIDGDAYRAREEGVDVACAVQIVALAGTRSVQGVIVASEDRDLIPAIEFARANAPAFLIETVTWEKGHAIAGRLVRNTQLRQDDFNAIRDRHNYYAEALAKFRTAGPNP